MQLSRRQFFKVSAGTIGGTSLAALGMMPAVSEAAVREYKILKAKETRTVCTYCSVGCGMLVYSMGGKPKNSHAEIMHIEGDPDHPVSRGSLCPKGAGVIDYIHSPNRLKYPEVRRPGSDKWERISWEDAISEIARHMKDDRDANFQHKNKDGVTVNRWTSTGFLATSAGTNENGFVTGKFVRALGMISIDNQARVCHGSTVASLAATFGRGAMTNHWVDIRNADVVLVMGGNAAEAHPVGFKWAIEAKKRGAKLLCVDPRFNRTASVADFYAPIRSGSDIVFLGGLIRWLIDNNKINLEYVKEYTNAKFIVHPDYDFEDGYFSGWNEETQKYDRESWHYDLDENGYARVDETLQDPRCVFNLMRQHYEKYTPEMVTRVTGTPMEDFLYVAKTLGDCAVNDKASTILYALGWTQHTVGTQMIRTMAMVQLLLGNMGVPGGGVNALRGHSNIQGLTDLGLLSTQLPAYLNLPSDSQSTYEKYIAETTPKAVRPGQMNYWKNTPKFFNSLMKTFYGPYATRENNFAFDYLPKWDKMYDIMNSFEMMTKGEMHGFICQGFNPLAAIPNANKNRKALAKLKYLVIIDPQTTETGLFWQDHGKYNDSKPEDIMTTVYRLPAHCFVEGSGSIVNSARWLQWHYQAADAPGEAKGDAEILSMLLFKLRELYKAEGGAFPDPIHHIQWNYAQPLHPSPEEITKEQNGYALEDLYDETGKLIRKKGELLSGFSEIRADGSTASGCWIYAGSWTEEGNQMANRDNSDPSGLGITLGWAWAWPANRRILYNRASADRMGNPWDPKRRLFDWNGERWVGWDNPDFDPKAGPGSEMNPFIMNEEGVGRLFSARKLVDGPYPTHFEAMETPLGYNPLYTPVNNPAVRMFEDDRKMLGSHEDFPYVGTTYRLTEHFQFWTKNARLAAITQPQQFVEIGEVLAKEKGIKIGDKVKVSSNRGYIEAVAVVTKRITPLMIEGKVVHQIGVPLHWGFEGVARKGFLTNFLPSAVGDANTQTPEYKTFLVNIEPLNA